MNIDLKDLEAIMKLMTKHQVDMVEVEGLKISKKMHLGPKMPKKPFTMPTPQAEKDDLMFLSTSAPKLSLDEFQKFSSNIPKDIK